VKVAVVDATGKVVATSVIYPHEPQRRWDEAIAECARLCRVHKVELIAANLEAITGVHVYYAAPGGMKLHASIDCTLLSHSKELATLTVSPDVRAFLLRAQVVCLRCGYEAPH
jgi:uncharacterized protein